MGKKRKLHKRRLKYNHPPTKSNPDSQTEADKHLDVSGKRIRRADNMTIEDRILQRDIRTADKIWRDKLKGGT